MATSACVTMLARTLRALSSDSPQKMPKTAATMAIRQFGNFRNGRCANPNSTDGEQKTRRCRCARRCASTRCRNARKKNSSASATTQKNPQNVSTNTSAKFHHELMQMEAPKRTM